MQCVSYCLGVYLCACVLVYCRCNVAGTVLGHICVVCVLVYVLNSVTVTALGDTSVSVWYVQCGSECLGGYLCVCVVCAVW